MSKGLKIYACSGVGGADINPYQYWTADTKDYENSPAVNSLLSLINEKNAEAIYLQMTPAEKIEAYNTIDLYIVALVLAKSNLANDQKASVLQQMYNDGDFAYTSTIDSYREEHLNAMIDRALSDETKSYPHQGDIYTWFLEHVAARNQVLFTLEQQRKIASAINSVSGVGATSYGSLTQYIEQAGQYFLYRFIPENKRSKLPKDIQKKIKKQDEFYDYVLANWSPNYGTKADLDRVIRMNIISNYKTTPEKAVAALMQGEGIGISEAVIAIIGIVCTCLSTLVGVISTIIASCKTVIAAKATAKYAVPEYAEEGCPAASDWQKGQEYAKKNKTNTNQTSSWLKWGLIGAALLFLIKK